MTTEYTPKYLIVQFGRGHTVVLPEADVAKAETEQAYYIRTAGACTIRVWGTENGIGELAAKGPIKGKTILDRIPFKCRIPQDSVHMINECSPDADAVFEKEIAKATTVLMGK